MFGVTSSPYLLGAVNTSHLSHVPKEQVDNAQKLARSFYVDNCVVSVDNEEELKDFMEKSTEILAKAKMDLRMRAYCSIGNVDVLVNNKLNLGVL